MTEQISVMPPVEQKAFVDVNGNPHNTYEEASEVNAEKALKQLFDKYSVHQDLSYQGLKEMLDENIGVVEHIVNIRRASLRRAK